jgi:hypothetical protein
MFCSRQGSLRELVRVQREEHASTRELIRGQREESRRYHERRDADLREFNREILLRNEKVYTAVIAEMEEGRKQLEEGRKQIEANTKAVLSVLDRLNGGWGSRG